jgi:hypothetical protein
MLGKIKNWVEIRIGLDELIRTQLTEYMVPRNINILYTLGFVALAAFISQIITGFFLLIYYVPHSEYAFRSVQDIMNKVPYGWLFRQMHAVGSNLMVTAVCSICCPYFSWEATKTEGADLDHRIFHAPDNPHLLSERLPPAVEPVELLGHDDRHDYADRLSLRG